MGPRIFLVLLLMHFWVVKAHATQESVRKEHGNLQQISVQFRYFDEAMKYRRQIDRQLASEELIGDQFRLCLSGFHINAQWLCRTIADQPTEGDLQLFLKRIQV